MESIDPYSVALSSEKHWVSDRLANDKIKLDLALLQALRNAAFYSQQPHDLCAKKLDFRDERAYQTKIVELHRIPYRAGLVK